MWRHTLALIALLAPAAQAQDLYDWLGVAPIVVVGQAAGANGRYALLRAERFLRGPGSAGPIRIDIRQANAERDPDASPHALRLEEGSSYVALLAPSNRRHDEGPPVYRLVRGVRGARELPGEGRPAFEEAVTRCIEIQSRADDRQVWAGLRGLLDDTNPLLVDVALEQYLKFQRGEPALLSSLIPLLDHPQSRFRERAAQIIGQIARGPGASLPDPGPVRSALVARARKDGAVPVRVAATEALSGFPGEPTESILLEISREDPDQAVRYAAEKLLLERRDAAPRPGREAPAGAQGSGIRD